ncbi:unnamed protein product [Bemisia tabaci]|uniref:Uncharacterized protein n=1 Tax=Bemisia tabaci TaxID=7038 RepID=A0A9P0AKJ1_BEMTA|nr:unnamed protein product [Bemisia tabaci]
MSITCISCHQATRHLNPTQAEITQQPESGEWGIDLLLACPHCGQLYSAWVLNWDVVPLKGLFFAHRIRNPDPNHNDKGRTDDPTKVPAVNPYCRPQSQAGRHDLPPDAEQANRENIGKSPEYRSTGSGVKRPESQRLPYPAPSRHYKKAD